MGLQWRSSPSNRNNIRVYEQQMHVVCMLGCLCKWIRGLQGCLPNKITLLFVVIGTNQHPFGRTLLYLVHAVPFSLQLVSHNSAGADLRKKQLHPNLNHSIPEVRTK
jgi:hypothetical protein